MFSPIFVAGTKVISRHDFVAPLIAYRGWRFRIIKLFVNVKHPDGSKLVPQNFVKEMKKEDLIFKNRQIIFEPEAPTIVFCYCNNRTQSSTLSFQEKKSLEMVKLALFRRNQQMKYPFSRKKIVPKTHWRPKCL